LMRLCLKVKACTGSVKRSEAKRNATKQNTNNGLGRTR
jgi:hypothetical protein